MDADNARSSAHRPRLPRPLVSRSQCRIAHIPVELDSSFDLFQHSAISSQHSATASGLVEKNISTAETRRRGEFFTGDARKHDREAAAPSTAIYRLNAEC